MFSIRPAAFYTKITKDTKRTKMADLLPQELQQIQNASSYLATLLRRSDYVEWLWNQSNLRRRYALMEGATP